MKYQEAKDAIRIMMGWGANEDVLHRAAKSIVGKNTDSVMSPEQLKRRLRSFVDRCANNSINTLGDYLNNPIIKI